jgi:YkoY family integral membrane protein
MWDPSLTDVAQIAGYVGALVLLEGLFSADNALVLAVMVRHLPRIEQRRVLMWGIWGAIGFRVLALSLSSMLLTLWYCKVAGGLYLLYLAGSHFLLHRDEPGGPLESSGVGPAPAARRLVSGFCGTVVSITITDIVFSIDSILAAVAMAESFPARFGDRGKLYIVLVGGILGIITMRFVVKYFLILLERFPGLDDGAYYLVAWIGLKLLVSGLHARGYLPFHIHEAIFWLGMIAIAVLSLVIKPAGRRPPDGGLGESLDLLDSGPIPPNDDAEDDPPGSTEAASRSGARAPRTS